MPIGNLIAITSHGLFSASGSVTCDYPSVDDVRGGVSYAFGTKTGDIVLPDEAVVLAGIGYGSNGTELVGTFGAGPISPPTDGTSPFAAIAVAVKARLISRLGLAAQFVKLVANDRYKVTIAENFFVYLQIFGITKPKDPALDYTDAGAGRLSRPFARRLRVYVYTRHGVDQYGDDTVALGGTDPSEDVSDTEYTPGQLLAEEMVLNALDDFLPQTTSGQALTLGPLHPLDSSEYPERPAENEAGLLRSCIDFEAVALLAISPADPALA